MISPYSVVLNAAKCCQGWYGVLKVNWTQEAVRVEEAAIKFLVEIITLYFVKQPLKKKRESQKLIHIPTFPPLKKGLLNVQSSS